MSKIPTERGDELLQSLLEDGEQRSQFDETTIAISKYLGYADERSLEQKFSSIIWFLNKEKPGWPLTAPVILWATAQAFGKLYKQKNIHKSKEPVLDILVTTSEGCPKEPFLHTLTKIFIKDRLSSNPQHYFKNRIIISKLFETRAYSTRLVDSKNMTCLDIVVQELSLFDSRHIHLTKLLVDQGFDPERTTKQLTERTTSLKSPAKLLSELYARYKRCPPRKPWRKEKFGCLKHMVRTGSIRVGLERLVKKNVFPNDIASMIFYFTCCKTHAFTKR